MTTITDHIVVKDMPGGHLFYCERCGLGAFILLPAPFDKWLAESKRFTRAHSHCRPADENGQQTLIPTHEA